MTNKSSMVGPLGLGGVIGGGSCTRGALHTGHLLFSPLIR